MSETTTVERVRWYTLARKFPQLIGRTPDGARIPGGPYTVTQAVGGMAVLAVGYYSMGIWARFGTLGNYATLLAVTVATIVGLGRIPLGARNPVSIAVGAARAAGAPRSGRLRGRAVRIRAPHQVRSRVVLCRLLTEPGATTATAPEVHAEVPALAPEAAAPPSLAVKVPEPATAPAPSASPPPARPRRRPASSPSPRQLTGVQALMATVGPHPEDT